jgi:creatinine amidohydrolase
MLPRTRYTIEGPKALPEMTWPEIAAVGEQTDIVLVGVGSCEAHGHHMPLATDTILGVESVRRIAARLEQDGIVAVPGPTIPFGISPDYMAFPGTVTLRPSTLLGVLRDVCTSLARHGFRKIVLILTHDGNLGVMQASAQELTAEGIARVLVLNPLPVVREKYAEILKSTGPEGHAGEGETARVLASQPELVDLTRAVAFSPERRPRLAWDAPPHFGGAAYEPPHDFRADAPPGSIGNPALATRDTGEKGWALITEWSCEVIKRHFVDA